MTFYDDIIAEVHAGHWAKEGDIARGKSCLGMMIALGGRMEVLDSVHQAIIEWAADHALVLPRPGGDTEILVIIAFNDAPDTTADDVIHVVKRARELAEAEAH